MNIFIVPSCIQSLMGVIDAEKRYEQTLRTFDSVRELTKDSIIVFTDSSVYPLSEDKKSTISSKVDFFLDFNEDPIAQKINQLQLKSDGECYLLKNSILFLKEKFDLPNLKGRMFKLGGRCELQKEFDINEYSSYADKFVFKKRLVSWTSGPQQKAYGTTHLLDTRMYSWDFNLTDEYVSVIDKSFPLFALGLDTEHTHFLNIDKNKLIELDKLHVGCYVAADGRYVID